MEAPGAAETDFIAAFIDSPPQTNEIARSSVLIATAHRLAAQYHLPLELWNWGPAPG